MQNGLSMDGGMLPKVPPNATREQQIAVLNDVIDRLNALLKTQVFADGTTKRMLIGYQKDGWGAGKNFGIKISQEGVDVMTARHDQLIFSMDMEVWQWLDPDESRNYVNIGKRATETFGFEMAKPNTSLDDPNA